MPAILYTIYINFTKKGGLIMVKKIAKVAEKYAKVSNNACIFTVLHQPKMPKCLVKKDK